VTADPHPLVSDLLMKPHLIQSCSDAPHAAHHSITGYTDCHST
jgi:hypothetical protein